jgi:hypothetical protein
MEPKRLPYGISDFENLVTDGYAYVDKTRYLELMERENNPYQIFIRPRKFGKSLLTTTLRAYYERDWLTGLTRSSAVSTSRSTPQRSGEHLRYSVSTFPVSVA